MSRSLPTRSLLGALLALGLGGCSTPSPMSRIDKNRDLYESWPLDMQQAILDGKVVKGMTPDMVKVALGDPTRVDVRSGSNGADETWVYAKSSGMNVSRPNVSLGGGMGGLGVSTGRRGGRGGGGGGGSRTSTNADEQDVVFQNGVVLRVD